MGEEKGGKEEENEKCNQQRSKKYFKKEFRKKKVPLKQRSKRILGEKLSTHYALLFF